MPVQNGRLPVVPLTLVNVPAPPASRYHLRGHRGGVPEAGVMRYPRSLDRDQRSLNAIAVAAWSPASYHLRWPPGLAPGLVQIRGGPGRSGMNTGGN
jgi:hypothetical protein